MNHPIPLIALLTLGSKFIAKKYDNNRWALFCLLVSFFTSTIVFYAGFAHLVPSTIFSLLACLPILNAFIGQGLEQFGWGRYSIPVALALNCIAVVIFTQLGFLKTIQAAWSLGLISSVVATINSDFIKPLKKERNTKHEYPV